MQTQMQATLQVFLSSARHGHVMKRCLKDLTRFSYFAKLLHTSSQHRERNKNDYDIIISGSGMVGSAMACGLGDSKYMAEKRILMVDGGKAPDTGILDSPPSVCSNRVCAISPGSAEFLKKLNIWDLIPRKQEVTKMQVWDACSEAHITFGDTELCTIVENRMLVAASARSLLHRHPHVDVMFATSIVDCDVPRSYARDDYRHPLPPVAVQLSDGTALRTKLLIGADGANSFLAKKLNLPKIDWSYEQSAVVATLQLTERCENSVAWQRFLPTGPIALLPLDELHSSLVWSTSASQARDLCAMTDQDFTSAVNDAFWKSFPQNEVIGSTRDALKNFIDSVTGSDVTRSAIQCPPSVERSCNQPQCFPLGFSHASEYVRCRTAFVGDAVHRIHPLAGQGANMGYRDVQCLLRVLEEAVSEGRDIGQLTQLMEYESKSQLQNCPVLFAADALNRMYSTTSLPVVWLRTVGLIATHSAPFVKEQLILQAMR